MTLTGPGTNAVNGAGDYNASTRTATFTPDDCLAPGVVYTAEVDATSTGGMSMIRPRPGRSPPWLRPRVVRRSACSAAESTPAVPAWNDNDPVTVGVRFSSADDGTVTAIKFYAGPGNTGPQTVSLWSSSGDQARHRIVLRERDRLADSDLTSPVDDQRW